MKTKYAKILNWIAAGEKVQIRNLDTDDWETPIFPRLMQFLMNEPNTERFRLEPKKFNCNGHQLVSPMLTYPDKGSDFFMPCTRTQSVLRFTWLATVSDHKMHAAGLCYQEEANAQAHLDAMLAPSRMAVAL